VAGDCEGDKVRRFDFQQVRVESGPIQFGDDWPGIFLRGDEANAMSFYLLSIIERIEKHEEIDPLSTMYLKGLANMLAESRV
jgi:hypothetical protein